MRPLPNTSTKKLSLLLLSLILLLSCVLHAQFRYDFKKNADNFYTKGDYYSAAIYYEKFLTDKGFAPNFDPYEVKKAGLKADTAIKTKPKDYEEILYRIANSYFLLNDYSSSEKWFAKINNMVAHTEAVLQYGICLRANGKYDKAKQQFENYIQTHQTTDAHVATAKKELNNCNFIQTQNAKKEIASYHVQKMDATINKGGASYAPSGYQNTFFFTATRRDSTSEVANASFINNIYAKEPTSIVPVNFSLPNGYEQGTASFTADGNVVLFTRWTKKSGKNSSAIYMAKKENAQWKTPTLLDDKINVEGYNARQPWISDDGSYMLFASDQPGGLGKFDLWVAWFGNDFQVSKIQNLGNTINTEEDEQAPYYYADAATLVFASNGRVGMGGFDLFESKGNVNAGWSMPINMEAPINSVKDDIYFYNAGGKRLLQQAYFSSDRSSPCCLEMYSLNKEYKKYVLGTITDCNTKQPIKGATLQVLDADNNKLYSSISSNDIGSYSFERIAAGTLLLSASKAGYQDATIRISQADVAVDTIMHMDVCQIPIVDTTPIVIAPVKKNIDANFEFNTYVLNDKAAMLKMDSLVVLLQREPKLSLEINGYTDEKGSEAYNLKLSELRAITCRDYFVKMGVDTKRLIVKGLGKCCPIQPETTADGKDDPEARKINRRVEFKLNYQL